VKTIVVVFKQFHKVNFTNNENIVKYILRIPCYPVNDFILHTSGIVFFAHSQDYHMVQYSKGLSAIGFAFSGVHNPNRKTNSVLNNSSCNASDKEFFSNRL